jgi:hypothetical protein
MQEILGSFCAARVYQRPKVLSSGQFFARLPSYARGAAAAPETQRS